MPIKIPRYTSNVGIPDSVPYGQASGAAWAAPYAAASLGEVATTLGQIATERAKLAEGLRREDEKLDLATAFGNLKVSMTQRAAELQEQGVDPDAYMPALMDHARQEVETLSGSLKYPGSRTRFMTEVQPFLAAQQSQAITETFKIRSAFIEGKAAVTIKDAENAAVNATTVEDRNAALGVIKETLEDGVRSRRYSGGELATRLLGSLKNIQEGDIARSYADPASRAQTLDMLLGGKYKYLDPKEQPALARTLQAQTDADTKRMDAAAEKAWKAFRTPVMTEMMFKAVDKTLSVEDLRQQAVVLGMSKDEVQDYMRELERPAKDVASDPATLDRVILGTHGLQPTMSDQELNTLRQQGLLSTNDWKQALDKKNGTIRHNEERGQTLASQQQSQAEQMLRAELGISQMAVIENLDPVTKRAYARGMRELTARSNAFPGGKEPPLEVIKDIVPRLKTQIGAQAQETERELIQSLSPAYRPGPFTTETGLAALGAAMGKLTRDYSQGLVTKGQLDTQVEYLAKLHDIVKQRLARRIEDAEKGTQPARATAAPKPAGRGNVPAARPD